MSRILQKVLYSVLKAFLRAYQLILSPIIGKQCRFVPSCSQYAILALQKHGISKGLLLATKRIFRCHPWGKSSGLDLP
ncbi:MAG: membrane protein insertion efficiency factor YidD [Holosporales bacterium]|nr:membrane protein insertion efficiency factor YidD [Holosporales bacterium]